MAFSFSHSFLLTSLLLAFLCSSQADIIDQICPKTQNPSLCTQGLRSDRRSAGAGISGLGVIALDKALGSTTSIKNFVNALSKVVTDPALKLWYNLCGQNFGDAVNLLNSSKKFLNTKDYINMLKSAASAQASELACDLQFEKPPSEPILIKQANHNVQDLSNIVAVIAGFLVRGS